MYLFEIEFSTDICPGVELKDHVGSIFHVLRNLHTFLHGDCTNLHSHQQCREGFLLLNTASNIVCRLFDAGHSNWCEVIAHCSFVVHFSNSDV